MIIDSHTFATPLDTCRAKVDIECHEHYFKFPHLPKLVQGDPQKIAVIGHWDGWQPFRTSGKHSCGKIILSAV